MNAFADALDAIFEDPNMGVDVFWRVGAGEAVPVRVMRRSPDEVSEFGASQLFSETTRVDVRTWEMPEPARGDELEIAGEAFIVQGEPQRDSERLTWTLDLRPA